jgi:hypothetical protein
MSSAYWCGGFSTGLRCLSAYAVGPYHRIALLLRRQYAPGLAAYVRIYLHHFQFTHDFV